MTIVPEIIIERDVPLPTWFGVGGGAKRLAKPSTIDELGACLEIDPTALILGDGANLLVADAGVEQLVLWLGQGEFAQVVYDEPPSGSIRVIAGAGVKLTKLITDTQRLGFAGLEALYGIPASLGGALAMNAGGKYGSIGEFVTTVHGLTRDRQRISLKRNQIDFAYRKTTFGLPPNVHKGLIVTSVELKLKRSEPAVIRTKLKDVMEYKKTTQPLGDNSAGCAFKNPTLERDLPGIAVVGSQVSAGMLIDKAGCKGMKVGLAEVSMLHGNFITSKPAAQGGNAADVITLMRQVRDKVKAAFDVELRPEVVIWGDTL